MALFKGLLGVASALLIFCSPAMSLSITPAISFEVADPSRCTDSPHWMAGAYNADDCASALRLLFWIAVRRQPLEIYDFLAEGEIPRSSYPVVETPRRFVKGTCTVAIVMLKFFDGAGVRLPDQPVSVPTPGSDIATWQSLWAAATRIHARCGGNSAMGWETEGYEGGIGIFIWGTRSAIDRSVP
jgi:hypothetical protein